MDIVYTSPRWAASKDQEQILLLPCAGFGRRVGSPNSKEILVEPLSGQPLINTCLLLAQSQAWPVHVITRSEKTELIEYLTLFSKQRDLALQIQVIKPSREWPDTLLQSKVYWRARNLVLLPDTQWSPLGQAAEVMEALKSHEAAYARFLVAEASAWGMISKNTDGLIICEKPQIALGEDWQAWGIMGFRVGCGEKVLKAHLESTIDHQPKQLSLAARFIDLDDFKDLTR